MSMKGKVALCYEYGRYEYGSNKPHKAYHVRDVIEHYLLVSMVDHLMHIIEPEDDNCVSYLVPLTRACQENWLFFDDVYIASSYAKSRKQNAISRELARD